MLEVQSYGRPAPYCVGHGVSLYLVSFLVSPCALCAALSPARIDYENGRASGRNKDPSICCLGSE